MPPHTQDWQIELPRPYRLLWTVGWGLTESIGLPAIGYVLGQALDGRNAAMLGGTAVLWLIAIVRKVVMGSVPGLVTISALVMTVQAAIAVSTGQCAVLPDSVPARQPRAGRALRTDRSDREAPGRAAGGRNRGSCTQTSLRHPSLNSFFQGVTWLWASLFFLMTVGFTVMMLTERLTLFLLLTTAVTVGIVVVGAGFSALWFSAVIRKSGLRVRFATA